MEATIYALSTGSGRAGLAVIRVSGPAAGEILAGLLGGDLPRPRRAHRSVFRQPETGAPLDDGLALWFPAPSSYTGEDVAELHIHGGRAVISAMLEAVGRFSTTRLAEPGEFTRRAFLNDKMDLTSVEGLADLIDAETEAQRRQALRQAQGALGAVYESWRGRLMRVLAHVEAMIDFPDEELPEGLMGRSNYEISALEAELTQHIEDGSSGERLRSGVDIAIIGPPNAGKSSLLNLIAGREAAIVSETAGTTRDVIEVRMDLGGFAATILDTAGLREALEAIEAEGVRRARDRATEADVRIAVFDGSAPLSEDDTLYSEGMTFTVVNKSDIADQTTAFPVGDQGVFLVSAKTGAGIEALMAALTTAVSGLCAGGDAPLITRARHREAALECLTALRRSQSAALPELMAEDLRQAMRALGRITGVFDVEDLLDIVFHDFCIGK